MSHRNFFKMRENEHELIKMRKHWFILLRESFSTLILVILPFFAALMVAGFVDAAFFTSPVWVALSSMWLLLCVMLLATVWTNYILDICLVSSGRIIYAEQFTLFNREAVTVDLARVQDVSVETKGVFATLLNFGTIQVQTAGAETHLLVFEGMPDPEIAKDTILRQASVCSRKEHSGLH